MNNAIRWGIWGTGTVAHHVASDFQLTPGATLQAVASRTGLHAKGFAAEFGVATWYEGLEPLLRNPEIDVVYVATPNHCHLEDCLACIRAGKGVLCEKPFALNLAQAQIVVEAARQHNVFCMEGMWTRFIPAVREAKRRMVAGEIGPVRFLQGNFAYPVSRENAGRLVDVEVGGGALLDRGVYLLSLAQHLLGTPTSIHGSTVLGPTGVDEQSSYHLVYAGGTIADLTASLWVRGTNEFSIYGERGWLRLCDPFYGAHRLETRAFACPQTSQASSRQKQQGLRGMGRSLRRNPFVQLLRRRLGSLLGLLERNRFQSFPFAGNGYQFELMEVTRCLQNKRTESDIMPLNDTLEVMRLMDTLRSQWGLVYPQEDPELQREQDDILVC